MNLSLIVATWFQPEWARCVASWGEPAYLVPRCNILDAYQHAYEQVHSDVLGYVHDDVIVHEDGWKERVLAEFADPSVVIAGFAGAPGYGHPRMYSQGYHHSVLGRVGFQSNMLNAEQHGARFAGSRSVAVLDGMTMFVRRSFLDEIGGWNWREGTPCGYFMYTEALSCLALRHRKRIRLVGVSCEHLGGKSTGLNPNLNPDFEGEHRWLWESFKDVLPSWVEG